QKDSLRGELDDLYLTYNSLETNNKEINDSLFKQKQKVEELMQELKNTKSGDYARINILKKEIATLKKVMKSFVKQIDSLYQQNQILIVENTHIKNQYSDIVVEKDQLSNEKDSLQQTVKVAKALTAYSIQTLAFNRRGKSTSRIRKVEKFQVCFLLSENKVSTTGRKYVYLRVTKPSGEVLRNNNSGFFNYEGKSIAYSAVKEIEYNGNSQNICVYYNVLIDDLPDGNYSVFIFIDGTQIGDAKINLK
ncbi:MAG: hypothetical protein U9Q83_03480, partial [Bacteroidota bacterium]|nr:hypothetical protein [Bacteroidota bacterium]